MGFRRRASPLQCWAVEGLDAPSRVAGREYQHQAGDWSEKNSFANMRQCMQGANCRHGAAPIAQLHHVNGQLAPVGPLRASRTVPGEKPEVWRSWLRRMKLRSQPLGDG